MPNGNVCAHHTHMAERLAKCEERESKMDEKLSHVEDTAGELKTMIDRADLPQLSKDFRQMRDTVKTWGGWILAAMFFAQIILAPIVADILKGRTP